MNELSSDFFQKVVTALRCDIRLYMPRSGLLHGVARAEQLQLKCYCCVVLLEYNMLSFSGSQGGEVAMHSTVRSPARQLRAIVFINHLILAAGCNRTAADLQRWGEAFEERKGLALGGGGTGKWRRYLDGVLPSGALLEALSGEFPMLGEVLGQALWMILRRFEDPRSAPEAFIDRLRFDGEPLRRGKLTRLQRLMDAGHWQDLGCLLVILASRSAAHSRIRAFVQDRMLLFLVLVCLQPEFSGAEIRLFKVLDHYVRVSQLVKIRFWPCTDADFRKVIEHFRVAPARVAELIREDSCLDQAPPLEVAFTCLGNERSCCSGRIYSTYWDQHWKRIPLTGKAKQFLEPPLQMTLVSADDT